MSARSFSSYLPTLKSVAAHLTVAIVIFGTALGGVIGIPAAPWKAFLLIVNCVCVYLFFKDPTLFLLRRTLPPPERKIAPYDVGWTSARDLFELSLNKLTTRRGLFCVSGILCLAWIAEISHVLDLGDSLQFKFLVFSIYIVVSINIIRAIIYILLVFAHSSNLSTKIFVLLLDFIIRKLEKNNKIHQSVFTTLSVVFQLTLTFILLLFYLSIAHIIWKYYTE